MRVEPSVRRATGSTATASFTTGSDLAGLPNAELDHLDVGPILQDEGATICWASTDLRTVSADPEVDPWTDLQLAVVTGERTTTLDTASEPGVARRGRTRVR